MSASPPARSRLIDLADHLVVDSVAAGGVSRLPAVARLHQRTPVVDFAWLRLLPLRRRLATTLARPGGRSLLEGPVRLMVEGPEVERALLVAWLRRGLPQATVTEADDRERLSVQVDGGVGHLALDDDLTARTEVLLAQALLHLRPDPAFTDILGLVGDR